MSKDHASGSSGIKAHCEVYNSVENCANKEFVLNADGTILHDHKQRPVTVERFLATKPLRADVSSRTGAGNRKFSYMPGEVVTRTLNDAFGYNGWCLDVKNTTRDVVSFVFHLQELDCLADNDDVK